MLTKVTVGEALGLERGSVVVCIPLGGGDGSALDRDEALRTIQSVIEHTDRMTPLLIAGPVAVIEEMVEELRLGSQDRAINAIDLGPDASEIRAVNAAISTSFPSDVALVRSGTSVTSYWLPRLRAAACSDSTVASATPFSLGPGGVEICDELPFSQIEVGSAVARSTAELAASVSARSLCLWPRIASIGPDCAYIRRGTLELTGPLEESLALDFVLSDLAARVIAAGMVHVAADDVLVGGTPRKRTGPASPAPSESPSARDERRELIVNDERGRLRRALGVARTALRGLSVTIDGRALTSTVGGTQTYILELVAALALGGDLAVRVLVPHNLSERAEHAFAGLPGIELLSYEQALKDPLLTDVVHRPQQAFTADDMALLRLVGRRIVIGQQDLIAYHNYSYHRDADYWRAYRRTTRLALAAADQVVFFSEHARRDALAEDLLSPARTHVVGIGAEASQPTVSSEAQPLGLREDGPFLLCIGADYAHKNRPFAIELLDALSKLGWSGRLVLAGSHVDFGSSREHERELLQSRPELADRVIDVGPVDEPEKSWLYKRACALLYPTLYEGFGLLPLEAARTGLPCLFASQASLSETAGQAATLTPWDPRASAVTVLPLLGNGQERDRHLAQLRALPVPTWAEVAGQLIAVYEQAVTQPSSEAAPRAWQELDREDFISRLDQDAVNLKVIAQEYQDAYHALNARVAVGLPLIDEGGLLSPAQQRGLMRIAGRRRLGAILLAPFGVLGRLWPSVTTRSREDRGFER